MKLINKLQHKDLPTSTTVQKSIATGNGAKTRFIQKSPNKKEVEFFAI